VVFLWKKAPGPVEKKVNGVLVQAFLYEDQLRIAAELDGANNVTSLFVFTGSPNSPDYAVKGGVAYRLVKDQIGSPRLVVDSSTGAVAQRMDFDEFGVVTSENPVGFQPFGFAGGLYDRDTGLVRFGARDYDATTGRWSSKDTLRFAGGGNFYAYAAGDPVNLTDAGGQFVPALLAAIWAIIIADQVVSAGEALVAAYAQRSTQGGPESLNVDKFYHCKGSCDAARNGVFAEYAAATACTVLEFQQRHRERNPNTDEQSAEDQLANAAGRAAAHNSSLTCEESCLMYWVGLP
jgi:RHS repeat-associated protein